MKTVKISLIAVFALFMMQSCMVTRTTIGGGPVGVTGSSTVVYSSAKQLYLFWGLVPLGRNQPAMPKTKDLQVKTCHNFGDVLISCITVGIITSQTIRIIVKKEDLNR